MSSLWERFSPLLLGVISVIISILLKFTPEIPGFEKVIDGVISFSSIVLGFIAALLAIILGISKSYVIQHLYNYVTDSGGRNGKQLLFSYFRQSIFSGFIAVVISIYMYILIKKANLHLYDELFMYLWIFTGVFFIVSSYRIVSILMYTLFKHEDTESTRYEQLTTPTSEDRDYEEFRRQHSRDITD